MVIMVPGPVHRGWVVVADRGLWSAQETHFLLTPLNQFDQAGLAIHYRCVGLGGRFGVVYVCVRGEVLVAGEPGAECAALAHSLLFVC